MRNEGGEGKVMLGALKDKLLLPQWLGHTK